MAISLSSKEEQHRFFMLNGNTWSVIFSISLPLVLYNGLDQVFKFADTLIAANMSSSVISTVSFIAQIQTMLSAIGTGLAVGGGILIARYYGAGDMEQVNKHISTLVCISVAIALLILGITIPFAYPFLRLLRMPEDLLAHGVTYFMVEVCALVAIFINSIYFAIEKARGNTKHILKCNITVLAVKTSFTVLFIYVLKFTNVLFLPLASVIAHSTLTFIALKNLRSSKNPFKVSIKEAEFSREILGPILTLSLPVFFEKFAFSFGKVIVNSMCASYGSMVVGALGVSNRIGALITNPPTGFQEGEASLISQNLGNNNYKRALDIFWKTLAINMTFAAIAFILMGVGKNQLIGLFAKDNPLFALEIEKIFYYERLASILIALNTSVMGLLYGFGYTRISMILNGIRLFVYRIPPLWIIQHYFTGVGTEGVGIAMFISNGFIGITSFIVALFLIRKIQKNARIV